MTFGARLHAASTPAARCAPASTRTPRSSTSGARRLGGRAGAVRAHRHRGAGRRVRGGEAAVGVLRAVRQPRHRRPRAGDRQAREAGALVLLDVKRGDIGSTSQAYAEAYLDPASPIAADAITVSPFLGFGSLDPFVDTARKHDAGAVRARPDVQQGGAGGSGGSCRRRRTVTGPILDHLRHLNAGAVAARLVRRRRRRDHRRHGRGLRLQRPDPGPWVRRPGRHRRRPSAHLRCRPPAVLPSSSRELLRVGPELRPCVRLPAVRTTSYAPC